MDGKLDKLRIIACTDASFEVETEDVYEVLFNPTELNEDYEVEYVCDQAPGTKGTNMRFNKIKPDTFHLDLVFDGTGIYVEKGFETVPKQIEKFKRVALEFKGDTHQPRFLKIFWGTSLFKGILIALNLKYTLFKPDGTPLRAKAKATFKRTIVDTQRVKEEDTTSPDLTHVRIVKEGDTLPVMANRIYGDPSYYLEVARVNEISNFRELIAGQRIFFPPIDK